MFRAKQRWSDCVYHWVAHLLKNSPADVSFSTSNSHVTCPNQRVLNIHTQNKPSFKATSGQKFN